MIQGLEFLDHVRLNFNQGDLFFLNLTLALIMFGVALSIRFSDFKEIAVNPKPIIAGYISQVFLLPAITFVLILILGVTPSVALGMILVASCPGGNISNFLTSLAKGNTALSVSLTATSTLSAIIMTPFNFAFWGGLYVDFYNKTGASLLRPIEIDSFQMFQTVFILLGIPVVLGILFANYFERITKIIEAPLRKISLLVFIVLVVIMLKNNFVQFRGAIKFIFIIVLLHNGLALLTGYLTGTVFKVARKDRRAISIETGIQNSGLALTLIFNPKIFPQDVELGGMAVIAAWWGIWHIVSGISLATLWGRRSLD